MSATDLDLPVLMSADQIRRREFVATRRGYDPSQVRDFLDQVADQVQKLDLMLRDARTEADAALRAASEPRRDPYAQLAERVAGVLRSADEDADRIRRDARQEADRIIHETRADAERIRIDAEERAEKTRGEAELALQEARDQANRTIAGLSTKRDALVEQLASMQSRLIGVARDLESTLGTGEAQPNGEDDGAETKPVDEHRDVQVEGRTVVLGEADLAPGRPAGVAGDDLEADAQMALLDPVFEELWEGTETIELDVPDIPPLDLDWEDLAAGDEDQDR
jgi:DivIVA domain-containing protein